jgi:stage II sporulation protein D
MAPLKGVPCAFCQFSPHMSWKRNIRLKDMQDSLISRGHKIGLIKDIAILNRNRSGRIEELKITDRTGKEIILSGKDFREAVGPNLIKSNNYEVIMKGYFVDINGKGWGHGVGLCQWGAFGMALQQFNYKQILNYYYPHADMVDYHDFESSKDTSKSSVGQKSK